MNTNKLFKEKPMIHVILMLGLIFATSAHAEIVHLRCDLPGPRQVCVGKTVLPNAISENGCRYVVQDIFQDVQRTLKYPEGCYWQVHDPRSHLRAACQPSLVTHRSELQYVLSPQTGEPCAEDGNIAILRDQLQLRISAFGEVRLGAEVIWTGGIARSGCRGKLRELAENGSALIAFDEIQAGPTCPKSVWSDRSDFWLVNESFGELPPDLRP